MGKKTGRNGPDPMELDWDQVKAMCSIQCTRQEIASCLGIDETSLKNASKRDFGCTFGELRDEWARGGRCSLRRKQWKLADKSAAMAIFLGKQMLGQRDDVRLNHEGTITQEIVHYGNGKPKQWLDEDEEVQP